jgi:RNA polymerase sigma-70 factor, ECF subfamily
MALNSNAELVHNRKNEHAIAVGDSVAGDLPKLSPVSWSLALWEKDNGKASAAPERTRPNSNLDLFQEIIMPHMDAAYNLARWLMRNDADARDVVQESYLRAFRFFDGYKGGDSKAWLLAIVRNTSRTSQRRQSRDAETVPFDEAAHGGEDRAPSQEERLVRGERMQVLRSCIEMLPADFREVLILRELEEMSYQEIAAVTGLALGTVMSRLSRARKRLEECAANRTMEAAG